MRPIDQVVDAAADAGDLYTALEEAVMPLFYKRRDEFIDVMRHAIALNGSFFTAQRMLQEYVVKAYNRHAAEPANVVERDVTACGAVASSIAARQ
jgi:glucan phosphorylase